MPNLFLKIASQNGVIKLWRRPAIKSLVPLIDVARCFKFVEESNNFKNGIYNLTKRTQPKKLRKYVKINPKLKIIETNDEIPNKGYTLSNKKFLVQDEFL